MPKNYENKLSDKDAELFAKIKAGIKIGLSAVVGLVGIVGVWQSFYTIDQESQGLVRRLGKYYEITEPGLHFKLPYGIDKVDEVPIRKVQKVEFGFRTLKSGVDSQIIGADTPGIKQELASLLREEYLTLTGDLNMADVEWICQYKIRDPFAYKFNLEEPEETLRDVNLDVMKKIVGDGSIDEVLILNRRENEVKAQEEVQKLLDSYDSGIQVIAINLQSVNPPKNVAPYFNEVSKSMQKRETMINDARKKRNEIIPAAKGEAEQTIKQAEAFAVERVNQAKGDADKFLKTLAEYQKAPEITRTRLYLETMEKVLPQIGEKTIVEQKGAEGGILLNLNMGK